jgi:hypothetical protein
MNDAVEGDRTVAVPPVAPPETVVGMFEATWQNALRGGPVPILKDFPVADGPLHHSINGLPCVGRWPAQSRAGRRGKTPRSG